jgi:hypothetical protein
MASASSLVQNTTMAKMLRWTGGGRKCVLLIADAIRWAEEIMEEIGRRHPTKAAPSADQQRDAALRQKVEAIWK